MRCLVQFSQEFHWINFRFAELDSLLLMNGVDPSTAYTHDESIHDKLDSFLLIELPGLEVARAMCDRSILIRAIYELWCHSDTVKGVIESAKSLPKSFQDPYMGADKSWSVNVDSHCKSYSMADKQKCRDNFKFLEFKGNVNLVDADVQMWVMLDYSKQALGSEIIFTETELPTVPTYLGRLLAKGGMKEELKKYDLKKRLYLGPTSLDPSLGIIMANMAGVKKGQLAFDPFVGTASILVAVAHFGTKCFGSDIDPRVLRGQMYAGSADQTTDTTKRDIYENFKTYSLEKPELIRMDNHLLDRHISLVSDKISDKISDRNQGGGESDYSMDIETITSTSTTANITSSGSSIGASTSSSSSGNNNSNRNSNNNSDNSDNDNDAFSGMFDVIVTDPPYGIRAGAKKSGKRKQVTYTVSADRRQDHIPSTQHYAVEDVMLDLLHTAAKTLVCGGRLAYLIPTVLGFTTDDLPKHPCLRFIRMCEQQLSTRHGRHAVLMEKYRNYTSDLSAEFIAYKAMVVSGQDSGFGSLMGRLEAALSVDAFDNESVVKKCSNSSIRRKESKIRRAKRREEEGADYPEYPLKGVEETEDIVEDDI